MPYSRIARSASAISPSPRLNRGLGDQSNELVEDAVTFALWLQSVFTQVLGPAFAGGLGQLSLGIGVDYGEAVVGCVGIRGNKRMVFFGDPANDAAKLQEMAGSTETIISAAAYAKRPVYLDNGKWSFRQEMLLSGKVVLRIVDWASGDRPPKLR